MEYWTKTFCIAGAFVFALTISAEAAQLSEISGEVLVSDGTGFQLVVDTVTVSSGQQVFARPGGTAVLTYDDGCKVRIRAEEVVRIDDASPCAAGLQNRLPDGAIIAGAAVIAGGVGLAASLGGGDKNHPSSP